MNIYKDYIHFFDVLLKVKFISKHQTLDIGTLKEVKKTEKDSSCCDEECSPFYVKFILETRILLGTTLKLYLFYLAQSLSSFPKEVRYCNSLNEFEMRVNYLLVFLKPYSLTQQHNSS